MADIDFGQETLLVMSKLYAGFLVVVSLFATTALVSQIG
jgi:hypothetical protein